MYQAKTVLVQDQKNLTLQPSVLSGQQNLQETAGWTKG